MKFKYLIFYTSSFLEAYYIHGHCIDIHSRIVSQGLHYVPGGTNPCTLCICDKGGPKWCKSVLCSPPQNCKSFQVGSSCCEFKCLDDILSGHDNYKETYDVALRFIASTVTAVLSISLLFFLYNRLKRNKMLTHHNHQRNDQRNLSNVGYIAGNFGYTQHNLGYLGAGSNEIEIRYEETSTNFSLWKPPGNYFPRGEAPPPYEEAMRSVQSEIVTSHTTAHNTLINSFSSSYPQEMNQIICRHEEPAPTNQSTSNIPNISSNTHQYVNIDINNKRKDKPEASYENIKVLKAAINEANNRPTSSGFNKNAHHRTKSKDYAELHSQQQAGYSGDNSYKIKLYDQYDNAMKNPTVANKKAVHRTLPKNLRELLSQTEAIAMQSSYDIPVISSSSSSSKIECSTEVQINRSAVEKPIEKEASKQLVNYQSLSQDEEDYRSECENCKSVISTIGDDEVEAMNETMSLQRRPLFENGYELCYRTSLTLPSNTRKQRSYPNSNREKWFSSMQQSSSEESD